MAPTMAALSLLLCANPALVAAISRPVLAMRPLAGLVAPSRVSRSVSNMMVTPAALSKVAGLVRGTSRTETMPCGGDGELDEECLALCDEEGCEIVSTVEWIRLLKVAVYIILWFGLSTGYNIQNKVRLNMLPLPWFQSVASLATGSAFVSLLWLTGLRKRPELDASAIKTYMPIAFCHSLGHVGAVVSAAAGAVSFTQIVKASEPVFTCAMSALLLGQTVSLITALSLVPVVAGVALASVSELSFTWLSFGGAMASNLAFATRNIFSRVSMDKPKGKNMTPENLFGVLTILSFLFALPFAFIFEGSKVGAVWAASALKTSPLAMLQASVATGLYFYTYNEVAMLALNQINPVTHAIANTLKRVVILLACVIFFKTPMTPLCAAGSAIAIVGSYGYALAKSADKARAKAAADKPAQ